MAKSPIDSDLGLALTFDDVLLVPAASDVMPGEVNVASRVTKTIKLNIPIISSAMDTVTEGRLAIAMAQEGGIGVMHRNLEPKVQSAHVAQVKKYRIWHRPQPGHHPAWRQAQGSAGTHGRAFDFGHSRCRG